MDRVEDRYSRIKMIVEMDKWQRETPEGRAFAEDAARIAADVEAEMAAEEVAAEPDVPAQTAAEKKQDDLMLLGEFAKVGRLETRCRFLDEATRTRLFALHERMARPARERVADPAAVAAAEAAPATEDTGCGDDESLRIRRLAENLDETEALVGAMEALDAMMGSVERRQEEAAAVDLSAPLPPPPADRPKPLTRAQQRKAKNLEYYAKSVHTQRIETRCRFLPEATRARLLHTEARYAEMLRGDIADPAAVAAVDATPDTDTACGDSQRAVVTHAVEVIGLTEDIVEMSDAAQADESP
jgi:hypothetical protein